MLAADNLKIEKWSCIFAATDHRCRQELVWWRRLGFLNLPAVKNWKLSNNLTDGRHREHHNNADTAMRVYSPEQQTTDVFSFDDWNAEESSTQEENFILFLFRNSHMSTLYRTEMTIITTVRYQYNALTDTFNANRVGLQWRLPHRWARAGRGNSPPPETLDDTSKFCMKFGHLILGKIIKLAATSCQILQLKCTKFYLHWGSASHPVGGVHSGPPDPIGG